MTIAALTGATASRRGPGRPRVEAHDEVILGAALALIDGGDDVTIARVVELSGVGRAAIYRRWPSLTDLVADALNVGRNDEPVSVVESTTQAFIDAILGQPAAVGERYPERRLRRRLRWPLPIGRCNAAIGKRTCRNAAWE